MLSQVAIKKGKLRGQMTSAAFNRGFEDARKGKPLNYDAYDGKLNDQWNYERGRMFAMLYGGPLKENRRVTYQAIMECSKAISAGWII